MPGLPPAPLRPAPGKVEGPATLERGAWEGRAACTLFLLEVAGTGVTGSSVVRAAANRAYGCMLDAAATLTRLILGSPPSRGPSAEDLDKSASSRVRLVVAASSAVPAVGRKSLVEESCGGAPIARGAAHSSDGVATHARVRGIPLGRAESRSA